MIALIIRDCPTRERSNKTIHFSAVVTLLLKRRLHVGNYLVWWHAIVTVDRPIPRIIRVEIVTPGWEPIPGVPKVRSSERKHDVVMVVVMPPVMIVPLCLVVAKHCVCLTLPILASLDASPLLELYRRRLCRIRLLWKIEVLWLNRLVLSELPFCCVPSRNSRSFVRLACSLNLASIRCVGCLPLIPSFGCLSLSLGLVLLALLIFSSSLGTLSRLSF